MKPVKKGRLAVCVLGFLFFVLGAVMATKFLKGRYQQEMGAVRQKIEHLDSKVIDTECGSIEYVQVGSGYPVLVIHGNGGGVDQGLTLAQGYLDQGYQVITVSRFGYLRSPLPDGATVEMQADAYACLLDTLEIKQAAVFTTSAGVTSTIQLALRHPDRVSALILHSPNSPGEAGLIPPPQPVFNALLRSDFAYWALTTYFGSNMQSLVGVPKGFVLTEEYRKDVHAALTGVYPVSQRADGMNFDTYIGNTMINHYPLEEVSTPTLVISAVDDPMVLHRTARHLAERIPGARLIVIADGGHMMLGHTQEVKSGMTAFLNEVISKVQMGQ